MNKKVAWSLVILMTTVSSWFVYHYFEKAFPFVHVSISMTAVQAEQEARMLSNQYNWNLQEYDCAVLFEDDGRLQAFVELEGGGKQAFIEMIDRDLYQPYEWCVRFFKEKEIHETKVWFTPDGKKNGFRQILPEDEEGNNVSESQARMLAEHAAQDWGYDLIPYHLVEHDEKIQPSKRLDHTFMYERSDASLNKGLYRLKIVVSGDQVTGVARLVKIPDEFNRRYAQMSSANTLIASLAKGIAVVLYFFVFGLFGLFLLYRKRYLVMRNSLKVLAISLILGVATWLNWLPLVWNYYVTTTSKSVFLIQILGSMSISIVMVGIIFGVFFMIAESFDRYAFGEHVQLFKLWTRGVAGSYSILEQTILGYCIAINGIGYLVGFYMLASSWGWWYPLQTNFDPNILSMYIPFLSPCIRALGAGVGEELIFRVLPIAGILLLTRNSKNQRYWLFGMIIVQSIIFGAAHAFYPQQPAYFRIVELFLEFMLYGVCYYAIGILPCMIAHFTYDALLMSTPIFTSTILLQKILALLFIGIPLWVVIIRWIQQGFHFVDVAQSAYNKSWTSDLTDIEDVQITRELGSSIPNYVKKYAYVFGAIGILFLGFSKEFRFDTPSISVSQTLVKETAQKALLDQFGDIGEGWNVLLYFVSSESDNGNKFIWQQYGDVLYQALQGSYVIPPHYIVRFVKFIGSVEQRAEEYRVMVSAQGTVLSISHTLPESQSGADISEHNAKELAYDFVNKVYELTRDDLEVVLCLSVKHEARRDWTIVLRDIKNYQQELGQAQIRVSICGDEIAGSSRFIDAPEAWKRAEQERLTKVGLFKQACSLIYLFLLFVFVWISSAKLGIHRTLLRAGGIIACAIIIIKTMSFINDWDVMRFGLNSAQPVVHQVQRWIMMHIISAIGQALIVAMLFVFVIWSGRKGLIEQLKSLVLPACALAFGFFGLFAMTSMLEPKLQAYVPLYGFVNGKSSFFAMLTHSFGAIVWEFLFIVAMWTLAHRYKSIVLQLIIFVLAGICFWTLFSNCNVIWVGIVFGIAWSFVWYLLYYYFYEKNVELLLVTLATIQCLNLIPSVWAHAYPTIMFDAILCMIILMSVAILSCRKLQAAE